MTESERQKAEREEAVVDREALETLVHADYTDKDTMHDLTHIRRVHRSAVRLAAEAGLHCEPSVLLIGAYLHGIVYLPERSRDMRAALEGAGVPEAVIERSFEAARESQTGATPETPEGIALHDGHLLEGGRPFVLTKTLVTGAARGSSLKQILEYWRQHGRSGVHCVLPIAQVRYEEQLAFAEAVFEEIARDVMPEDVPRGTS